MRNLLSTLIVLAVLCLARVASTQPGDTEERREAYRQGYAAVQAKKWDEAYAIFERLWREAPTYDVALHLGHAEFNLGKHREAAEHLAFGVAHLPPGEAKELAEGSRRALARVQQELGTVILIVDRSGASVRVDGEPRGTTPIDSEIFVDPGAHAIEVTLEGYQAASEKFELTRGEQRTVVLKLDPLPPAAMGPSPAPPPPREERPAGPSARTIALLSGAGVAVVAGVSTLVFGLKGSAAASRADDARAEAGRYGPNACGSPMTAPAGVCASLEDADDDCVAANRGANVSLAVTGVALLTTATLFIAWPHKTAGQSGAITVAPSASRNSGAVFVTGAF